MIIATLNVHALSGNRITKIMELIKNYDIIFFQEIDGKVLETMAKLLRMNCVYGKAEYLGNGCLTKHKIVKHKSIKLDVHYKTEIRNALKVTIKTNKKITIIATHLCHKYEKMRIKQFGLIEKHLNDVDFLVGDFNALCMDDYNEFTINHLNDVRKKSNWESCKFDLVEKIKTNKFNVYSYTNYTSRFNTRIDYIFYINKWKNKIKQYVIDCQTIKLSDHNMVLCELI